MSNVRPEEECFFIAPIGGEGTPERARSDDVLNFIVSNAAEQLGLVAVRGDLISKPGQITLHVIEHVLSARAAVADLTGLNPNVFYELAIRHTARLPTALIAEEGTDLPFDIAPMRTIFLQSTSLSSANKCRQEIVSHLQEAMDMGAVDSPVATSVDVKAMASGSVVERSLAELVTTVNDIVNGQRDIADQMGRLASDAFKGQEALERLCSAVKLLARSTTSGRIEGPAETDSLADSGDQVMTAPEDRRARRRTIVEEFTQLLGASGKVAYAQGGGLIFLLEEELSPDRHAALRRKMDECPYEVTLLETYGKPAPA